MKRDYHVGCIMYIIIIQLLFSTKYFRDCFPNIKLIITSTALKLCNITDDVMT